MKQEAPRLPVLEYIRRQLANTLGPDDTTSVRDPTRISQTLGFRLVAIGRGTATVELDADVELHGNQQGTVHVGLLCELADAAIGTAHSTLEAEGESFTSLDLKINFFRPVWKSTMRATAQPIQHGRTITHYTCDVVRDDGRVAATVISTLMTLRGPQAAGR
ncbi:MAG: PaaI family thioesterase [Hymenobacter sp.]